MIAVLLAVLVSGSPAPTPTASAAPETLKTIITLRSSPLCTAFATHVNAAIGSAVRNDAALGSVVSTLRTRALGENSITRSNAEQRLSNLADGIYREYRSGMNEINKLRALAATASSPAEKAAVKASADALGGALYRQHLIQRDLDGFVAFLDTADMRSDISGAQADMNQAFAPDFDGSWEPQQRGPITLWVPRGYAEQFVDTPSFPGDESPHDDIRLGALASQDFERRIPAIVKDELHAAEQIDAAGNGC